jgi:CDP-6-deoxy-D-xylo-4-hexulose-3-dehydrase
MIKLIKNTFYHETWTKIRLAWFILWAKQLSFGKKCEQFEKEFSKWQGRDDSIFVNSGSSANLAVVQALLNMGYLAKGDRVGFSALGWSTTVMPLIQLGLKPVPIDVMSGSLNINSVPKNINCLFMTNLLGICPTNMDDIVKHCKNNHIILIEDNCESLGSEYQGKKLGNFGMASTFSFYVGHHMSTIEGGMICTDNKRLARELRIVRAHGWDRNLDIRTQNTIRKQYKVENSFYSRYTFYSLGYNLRPTEIAGFLGLLQLPYLKEIVDKRVAIYQYLLMHINKGTINPTWMTKHSAFAFPIICKTSKERDELVKRCSGKIEVRPIVGGDLTSQPFYNFKTTGVTTARKIHETGLYIGINPDMTQSDLDTIVRTIND